MTKHTLTKENDNSPTPLATLKTSSPCNTELETARAQASIRELRWAILFARSEPEFFPCLDHDPDTGKVTPHRNDHPTNVARFRARKVADNPVAMAILANFGWTNESVYAD